MRCTNFILTAIALTDVAVIMGAGVAAKPRRQNPMVGGCGRAGSVSGIGRGRLKKRKRHFQTTFSQYRTLIFRNADGVFDVF